VRADQPAAAPIPLAPAASGRARRPSIIVVDGVTRRFGSLEAIRDVSFEIPEATILGLIGPSGSGKTTMIRMLTGTLVPTAGRITVMGEEPRKFTRHTREELAYMPQLFSLYPDLTAEENVGFVAALFGISPFRRGRRIRKALEVVDLLHARRRLARDLSGGMQRRLELACALVHEPSVLFIDEPTAGIDPMLRQSIWDELRSLRNAGRTLLVTTQYVGEAEFCDGVALLAEGELVALDDPESMRQSVFGGEIIELETDRPITPDALSSVEGVTRVRQLAPRRLNVVTPDAGRTTPRIVEALGMQGVNVLDADEYKPSFDEVFAELVERRRTERRANGGERVA
jgi:ABC-2 type transport system ATP-binding protein